MALIDYAEQNGLVYVWEFAKRQRLRSPVPAFTKRQQLLSPDQYNIVDVRTSRGVRRAMLFPKAILQAEFAANAPMRERNQPRALTGKAGGGQAASEKGAGRWREPPRRRRMRVKSGISPMAA